MPLRLYFAASCIIIDTYILTWVQATHFTPSPCCIMCLNCGVNFWVAVSFFDILFFSQL